MTEEQELANSRDLVQTLIKLNDNNLEGYKKREHEARKSAFSAGLFAIVLPFMLYGLLDHYAFDGEISVFLEEHKWAWFLMVGVFSAAFKGMKYLAVVRHDPERKKK